MSDTVVARLRERIETERDAHGLGIGLDAVAVDLDDLAALLDVVEAAVATLRWYADEQNYDEEGRPGHLITHPGHGLEPDEYDWEQDRGDRARDVLARLDGDA